MSDVTKLKLPLAIAAILISGAAGVGGTWAVAADRLATQSARLEQLEAKDEKRSAEISELKTQTQLTVQALNYVVEKVKDIDANVKELKRR